MSCHKILLSGYSKSVFKLFYLADDEGISDLIESFKALMLVPIGDNLPAATILHWATEGYQKKLENLKNSAQVHSWIPISDKELQSIRQQVEDLESARSALSEEMTEIISSSKYVAVPLKFSDGELVSIVNPRSGYYKTVCNLQEDIERYSGYVNGQNSWASQQLSRQKEYLSQAGKFLSGNTLFVDKESKKMCSSCIFSMDKVEGMCAPGGPKCSAGLGHLFKKEDA